MHGQWHVGNVVLCLLKRVQDRTIALQYAFSQIFVKALLFYENPRGGNMAVDEVSLIYLYLLFKADEPTRSLYAENFSQKFRPENLAVAFLISAPCPSARKVGGGVLLFFPIHMVVKLFCEDSENKLQLQFIRQQNKIEKNLSRIFLCRIYIMLRAGNSCVSA